MKAVINTLRTKGLHIVAVIGAVAFGLTWAAAPASAQITSTKHNLSAKAGTSQEICVFCHTPHGSNENVQAPLWNRTASTALGTTYTAYSSATLQGTIDLSDGVSLACLSCHDGTQAIDNVINDPGSGKDVAGWSSVGADSPMDATKISMLGTNLKNDHPVGVPFAGKVNGGGAYAGGYDKDAATEYKAGTYANSKYWVDAKGVGVAATREKTDMILYARSNVAYVECATCHDPHINNTTFLRIENKNSDVCLSCHNK